MNRTIIYMLLTLFFGQSLLSGPLHDAVLKGEIEQVKQLLDKGANLLEKDQNGKTALELVDDMGNELLRNDPRATCGPRWDYGGDISEINCPAKINYSAVRIPGFYQRLEEKQKAIVEELLRRGEKLNANNLYGEYSLIKAIKFNLPDRVKDLLSRGANPNAKDDLLHVNALYLAALTRSLELTELAKQLEIVRLLLRHGADFNAKSNKGVTALQMGNRSIKLAIRAWSILQQIKLSDEDIRDLEENKVGTAASYNKKFIEMGRGALKNATEESLLEDIRGIISGYLNEALPPSS